MAAPPSQSPDQRRGRRRTILRGLGPVWRALALAVLCASLATPTPARAATIFTPSIKTGVGYDDNVRQSQTPHGDTFVTATPGLTVETGTPDNNLMASATATFNQYHRLSQYNGFESGGVQGRWRYMPTPLWSFELGDAFSSSYDQTELNENGQLNQVRNNTGRLDRNTTGMRMTRQLGQGSQITAGYAYSVVRNDSPQSEDMSSHRLDLGLAYRVTQDYRVDVNLEGTHEDFERSDDVERGSLDLRLARLFGPHDEVWVGVLTNTSRSLSENPSLTSARDYETYTGRLGFKRAFSPQWELQGWGGFTYVAGDESANSAAGQTSPTGYLQVAYRRPLWTWRLYTSASMDEYSSLGQNTGLVDRKQVGTNLEYTFSQRWRLNLAGDYLRDDYKQDQLLAGTQGQGFTESWRLSSVVSYQLTKHWALRLDYRYLTRLAESDATNLEQNRLLLLMDYELPYRW